MGDERYYSNPIEKDFGELLPLLGEASLDWMSVPSNTSSPLTSASPANRQRMLWIGKGGVTTPTHNDAFHNVYVQLKGTKRFILFPPSLHTKLHLFPALHPQHQQSQLLLYNMTDSAAGDWSGVNASSVIPNHFPNFRSWATSLSAASLETDQAAERPLSVTLAPGEVLYIPPLWYHYTTSLSPSASLNVWTTSDEAIAFQEAFGRRDAVAEGCLFGQGAAERAISGRNYLNMLLGVTLASGAADGHERAAKDFVRDAVLVPRYFPLLETAAMPSFSDPTKYLFCAVEGRERETLQPPSKSCAEAIRAQSDALAAIDDRSILELQLADIVEFTALWAVGAHSVSAFLLDFARC